MGRGGGGGEVHNTRGHSRILINGVRNTHSTCLILGNDDNCNDDNCNDDNCNDDNCNDDNCKEIEWFLI